MSDVGGDLYDHYEQYFGSPIDRRIFGDDRHRDLQILAFNNVFSECMVFATFGLSGVGKSYAEIIVPVDDGWDLLPEVLANACFFCIQNEIAIRPGTLVSGIDRVSPLFVSRYAKSGLLLVRPYGVPPGVAICSSDGASVSLFFGIFVSAAECLVILDKGVECFEGELERRGVDPFAMNRQSLY